MRKHNFRGELIWYPQRKIGRLWVWQILLIKSRSHDRPGLNLSSHCISMRIDVSVSFWAVSFSDTQWLLRSFRFPMACLWGSIGIGMLSSNHSFRIGMSFTIVTTSKGYSISFKLSVYRKLSLHSLNCQRTRFHSIEPLFCSCTADSNCGGKWF